MSVPRVAPVLAAAVVRRAPVGELEGDIDRNEGRAAEANGDLGGDGQAPSGATARVISGAARAAGVASVIAAGAARLAQLAGDRPVAVVERGSSVTLELEAQPVQHLPFFVRHLE